MQILDCTFRDGGYYTDWDFNGGIVKDYLVGMNSLPIDYIELGYRSLPTKEYQGKFGYTPVYLLQQIRALSKKKLAVMLNEKSTLPPDLTQLTEPIKGLVNMIRLAVDPKNLERAIVLAKAVKEQGFEVGFNIMYMSKWDAYPGFYEKLPNLNGVVDIMNMVDSFGGIMPNEIEAIMKKLRSILTCKIGFHGHNNLQMSLANTIAAINSGVDSVDCTILGMGRGAGNLNTELLLTYLNRKGLCVDFNVLGDVISVFQPLQTRYQWGTQLPYMISGAYSIPQKEVMEMVTNRVYSFNSVVRSLQNRANKGIDESKYPILPSKVFDNVLIVGGGPSPIEHLEGILSFVKTLKSVAIVFATARHASYFEIITVPKYYCLAGQEAKRIARELDLKSFNDVCVIGPYPRKFGTEVPEQCKQLTFEISGFSFTSQYPDSCTTLAIQTAIDLKPHNIFTVGYDGYPGKLLSEREVSLNNENESLFLDYKKTTGKKIISLTPSVYNELEVKSVYQIIQNN